MIEFLDPPPDVPAPWDGYRCRPFVDGKPVEPANDRPSAFELWGIAALGWTWSQYVTRWKLNPRGYQDAPPF